MGKIKDIFIPHKHNGYKPHAIRSHGLLAFAAYILVFQVIYNFQTTNQFKVLGYATEVSAGALLTHTNTHRAVNGMGGFTNNAQLAQAAQAKANHMIANDYWAHYAPDGTSPWFFIEQAGYNYSRAGENLAYGFGTSSATVQGWMDSPSHRANILDAGFTEVGFGIANGSNFQGGENTVVVAMYGEPIYVAPASNPAPAAEAPAPTAPEPVAATEDPTPEPASEPAPEPEPEPISEPEQEPAPQEEEPSDTNQQRLLAEIDADGDVVVTGEGTTLQPGGGRISNLQALVNGSAHWSMYMILGGFMVMGAIFMARHLHAFAQLAVHGEHFVAGHPTIEASIIYVVIWLMLYGTYGVIG